MRRAPLMIAALLGLVAVLALLLVLTRRKPEATLLAGLPSVAPSNATLGSAVVADVHAAVPAASVSGSSGASGASVASVASDVTPMPSTVAPSSAPATAKPAEQAAPRAPAIGQAPAAPRYTYFGGRR